MAGERSAEGAFRKKRWSWPRRFRDPLLSRRSRSVYRFGKLTLPPNYEVPGFKNSFLSGFCGALWLAGGAICGLQLTIPIVKTGLHMYH